MRLLALQEHDHATVRAGVAALLAAADDAAKPNLQALLDHLDGAMQHDGPHFLLTMYGDVEPAISEGMETEDDVADEAREHRADDPDKEDGLYSLHITPAGALVVDSWSGGFLDGDTDEEEN